MNNTDDDPPRDIESIGVAAVLAALCIFRDDENVSESRLSEARSYFYDALYIVERSIAKRAEADRVKQLAANPESDEDFIRRVVRARTLAIGRDRLIDFLHTEKMGASWKRPKDYRQIEEAYREWWRKQCADKKRKAGKRGAEKKWRK